MNEPTVGVPASTNPMSSARDPAIAPSASNGITAAETSDESTSERPWSEEGFLAHLPDGTSIVLRLPLADDVMGPRRATFATLLGQLGWGEDPVARLYGAAEPAGVDGGRAPGFARTSAGAWIHYLPARDKADLNRALAARSDVSTREVGDWILMAHGNPKGQVQGDPMPPGDFGLVVRSHPLLAVLAQPGDRATLSGCRPVASMARRGA